MEEVWVVYLCLILLIIVLLLMRHNPHVEEAKKERESKSPPPSSSFFPSSVGKQLEHTQEELENYLERLTHVLFDTEARKRDGHHDQKSHHHHHRSADVTSETKEHSEKEAARAQYLSSHTRVQSEHRLLGGAKLGPLQNETLSRSRMTCSKSCFISESESKFQMSWGKPDEENMVNSVKPGGQRSGQRYRFLETDEVGLTFQDLGADGKEKTTPPGSTENIVEEIEQAVQETVDTDLYVRRRQRPTASRRYREGYRPETAVQPETDTA